MGDKAKGIKEQVKGAMDKAVGSVTGNDVRRAKGEAEITEGSARKDLGDQKDNRESGAVDPGNPSNT
jgi:uncharacterized protein YjbJ (UPF0337 family)